MASNLIFISETIYGLKIEYGEEITVGTHNWTTDQATGIKTDAPTSFAISMAIPLPEILRESFFLKLGIQKAGRLQKGQREFLIDKSDLQTPIIENKSFIDYNGKRADVQTVDDYIYAMIVTTQAPSGNPTS